MILIFSKVILILITSLNLSNLTKINFFRVNLFLISLYTLIIFYFSFMGFFEIINILITIFLIINLFYFLLNYKKSENINYIFFITILLLVSYYFAPRGFLYWDEFTQWGIKPKEIFLNKSVYSEYITTNSKYWIIALYHNFIIYGLDSFDEKSLIFSQIFINLSCLMFVFSFLKVRSFQNFLVLIILFYFSSSIFNYGYYTVYLDILLCLYFLCLFLFIFQSKEISWKDSLIISFLSGFLFLIKGTSIVFGFLIFIYLTLIFIRKKICYKKYFTIISIFFIIIFSYQLVIILSNFGYHIKPDISYYSSKIEYNDLNNHFFSALYLNNIYEGKFLNFIFKILDYFQSEIFLLKFLNFKFNFYFWLIFFIVVYSLFLKYEIFASYFEEKLIFYIILVSLLFFVSFLYFAYKNYFGPAEASSMSSFGRYIGIFFLFWLFVIFIKLMNINSKNRTLIYLKWSIFLMVLISAPGKAYENIIIKFKNLDNSYQSKIFHSKENIYSLSKSIPNNKKIYFIDQDKDEFFLRVARFIIYPRRSNDLCSSLVFFDKDKKDYDCVIKFNDFKKIIQKYDYIFFLNNNKKIIENFDLEIDLKKIKTIDNMTLYEILRNNG